MFGATEPTPEIEAVARALQRAEQEWAYLPSCDVLHWNADGDRAECPDKSPANRRRFIARRLLETLRGQLIPTEGL